MGESLYKPTTTLWPPKLLLWGAKGFSLEICGLGADLACLQAIVNHALPLWSILKHVFGSFLIIWPISHENVFQLPAVVPSCPLWVFWGSSNYWVVKHILLQGQAKAIRGICLHAPPLCPSHNSFWTFGHLPRHACANNTMVLPNLGDEFRMSLICMLKDLTFPKIL